MSESEHYLEYCGRLLSNGQAALSSGQAGAQKEFALPGDQPHYARDRLVDIQHIKLEIALDPETKSISGTARTTSGSLIATIVGGYRAITETLASAMLSHKRSRAISTLPSGLVS